MFAKNLNDTMGKTKKTGKVKLYGEIYSFTENSATGFITRFDAACKDADEVEIQLHTQGGDVLEGSLIYNHIKGCSIPVSVVIAGVSCSMGTIIMMAANRVYMCENSYLMVHAPQGGCFGTAAMMEKAAKGLRGMEKNFKKVYATKTGKTEKEIEDFLVGDNWFTAQEAVEAKLIDGIVAPIATDVTQVSAEELKTQTPTALYHRFSACLTAGGTNGTKGFNSNNHNKQREMDKEGLIKKFGLTGVTAQSSDDEIYAAIQTKMDADKERADKAEQTIANASKKQITDAVQAAFDAKKIDEKQKSVYVAIGEKSGFDALMVALNGLRPVPSLVAATRGGSSVPTLGSLDGSRASWTWAKWQEEDPRGLEKLEKEEPEKFEALYNGAFK